MSDLITRLREDCLGPRLSDEAADEIERLQSLVDRLPKTADGVPVRPGDQIWFHKGIDTAVIRKVVDGGEYGDIVEIVDAEGLHSLVALDACYSAREATKAEVQS